MLTWTPLDPLNMSTQTSALHAQLDAHMPQNMHR
jgi:hypothetical protein